MNRILVVVTTLFLVAGCASSTKIERDLDERVAADGRSFQYSISEFSSTTDEAPEHFLGAVRSYLEQDLRQRAMLANPGPSDREVKVTLTDYRMRSGFNRAMFGMLAGKDGVESRVTVVAADTGEVIGSSTVSSFNVTAVGSPDDIAKMHAKEIGKFLAGEAKEKK